MSVAEQVKSKSSATLIPAYQIRVGQAMEYPKGSKVYYEVLENGSVGAYMRCERRRIIVLRDERVVSGGTEYVQTHHETCYRVRSVEKESR